jgi:hypothetical protein
MRIEFVFISNYRSFPFTDPPKRFPCVEEGSFSASVNVIVGPNGAGKTNFLNSIRKCFDRGTFTSQAQFGESDSDFYDPDAPVFIEIALEGVPGINTLSYRQPDRKSKPGRYLNNKEEINIQLGNWKNLKKQMFPSSFPRRMDNEFARNIAFDGDSLKNWEAINHAWEKIRSDAKQFVGLNLAEQPPEPPLSECPKCSTSIDSHFRECPTCSTSIPLYASDLLDENEKPLLEGSDGYSHFLYLIMEVQKHCWPTAFLIEEPDVFMHPGLQKSFLRYLLFTNERDRHQFFISTHSPYLLDFATRPGEGNWPVQVYRIFKTNRQSHLRFMNSRARNGAWETLRDLGHASADVLHPNGIIWVEGPSDKVYLQTWLDCFAQRSRGEINWGVDCDILWYGGSNLAHIALNFWEQVEVKRLLDLLTVNPQAAIVVDRDMYPKGTDKMRAHKEEVERACRRRNIFFWMTDEGKHTIEDYIPDHVRNRLFTNGTKVQNAKKYQVWANSRIKDSAYHEVISPGSHLEEQIRLLYEEIMAWCTRPFYGAGSPIYPSR